MAGLIAAAWKKYLVKNLQNLGAKNPFGKHRFCATGEMIWYRIYTDALN